MSAVKKDNRLEIRVTVSESDPDLDLVALVTYMKTLGKGSKPLISKALKAFYLPSVELEDKDKLVSIRASSIKCLLQQVQEILFASYEDGAEIPEYLLSFGRNILREQVRNTGLSSQLVLIPEKAEASTFIGEIKKYPTETPRNPVVLLDGTEDDDEDDDENPFGHIELPSDFDPEVGKIDVNL